MLRLVPATLAAAVAALSFAAPASAVPSANAPVKGWSAMADVPAAKLLEDAQDMPISNQTMTDQPYCATNGEIAQTLRHDFAEEQVDTAAHQGMGTQLWGSDLLGTWTLVATRSDKTSCIIASGIGYSSHKDSGTYYDVIGLN